jgi:hypothetical protein
MDMSQLAFVRAPLHLLLTFQFFYAPLSSFPSPRRSPATVPPHHRARRSRGEGGDEGGGKGGLGGGGEEGEEDLLLQLIVKLHPPCRAPARRTGTPDLLVKLLIVPNRA